MKDRSNLSRLDQIAEGVYRLGTEWVGWYLYDTGDAITVVDCGFAGYFDQLPRALSELGRPLDAVDAVVLTHYHSDHVGSAERIRTEAKARVLAPEGDAGGVRSGKVPMPGGLLPNLWRPVMLRYMAHATRNGGARVTPVAEVETYGDGQVLDVPGGLRAIHTPGHTSGHCAVVAERAGVLFAGDALATTDLFPGGPGPRIVPFNEDAERARQSLSNLEGVSARVVAVGHGAPYEGTPADAVQRARAAA